jgi:hemerythrin
VSLYELFGRDPPELLNMKIKTRFLFEEAVANYHYRKISAAEKLFEHCFSKAPEDNVVALYRERCRQYRRHGKHHSAKELQEEIQWLPEYCTGIPEVDKRNKKLFTFAHRLVKAVDNKNKERDSDEGLQFLHDYANTHFAEEEQFLESIGYPFLENHQLQHRRFIKDLILMENEIALHKLVSSLYARFRIHILIVGWIIHHILGEDLHYARWYRNRSER